MNKRSLLLLFVILSSVSIAIAHGDEVAEGIEDLAPFALKLIYVTSILMIVLSFISIKYLKKLSEIHKNILFWLFTIPVVVSTIFLIGATIYINIVSPTHGPVHWHADFEINICGDNLMLEDPGGITNRIGSPVLHEHNDMRIHIEGTPTTLENVDFGSFFDEIGGEFTKTSLRVPTNDGMKSVSNGDLCNNQPGKIILFVESQEGSKRVWKIDPRLDDYIPAPFSTIPPGDRVKIIFTEKDSSLILKEINEGKI